MSELQKNINEVLDQYADELMAIPGVTGVYVGQRNGQLCLYVMVISFTAEVQRKIPRQLEGYPVEIKVSGEIKPFTIG